MPLPDNRSLGVHDRRSQALVVARSRTLNLGGGDEERGGDNLAACLIARDSEALEGLDKDLAALPQSRFFLRPENLVGLDALRRMAAPVDVAQDPPHPITAEMPPLAALVDLIEAPGKG